MRVDRVLNIVVLLPHSLTGGGVSRGLVAWPLVGVHGAPGVWVTMAARGRYGEAARQAFERDDRLPQLRPCRGLVRLTAHLQGYVRGALPRKIAVASIRGCRFP